MALQKQTIEIPFGVGIDTKTDAKQVQPGKLLALENGVFQKLGKLIKRLGLRPLAQSIFGGGTVPSGSTVFSFKDELNMVADNSFYSYYEAANQWVSKGKIWGVDLKSTILDRPPQVSAAGFTSASGGGLIVYAWTNTVAVYEISTGQPIFRDFSVNGLVFPGAVVFFNGLFYIYNEISPALYVTVYNPATSTFSANTLVYTFLAPALVIETVVARIMGTSLVLMAHSKEQMVMGLVASDGTFSAAPTVIATGTASTEIREGNFFPVFTGVFADDAIYVTYTQESGVNTLLRGLVLNTSFGTLVAAFTIATNTVSETFKPSMGLGTSNRALLFYSNPAVFGFPYIDTIMSRVQITRAGVLQDVGAISAQCTPSSNPFVANGVTMLIVAHRSISGQAQYLIMSRDGDTIAAFSYQNGVPGSNDISGVNNVSLLGVNDFVYCCGRVGRNIGGSKFLSQSLLIGAQTVRMRFLCERVFTSQEIDTSLHIAAGTVWNYEGVRISEMGFRTFPQNLLAAPTAGAAMGVGTRSYVAIYEWTDARGQIYRSAPSIATPFVIASGTNDASISVSTPQFTSKPQNQVLIALFRTVAAGTTFYRVGSQTVGSLTAFVNIADTSTDASIITREILYTTGGVLESIPPPSASFVSEFRNRAFLMSLEDENECWFSRLYVPGESPYFNDALTVRIDQGAGGITSGAPLDEKFVFFKQGSTYFISGQGPTDTGLNNDYNQPQLISLDVGCTEPKSVITIPVGIIFKSAKGFYLLDRGLNTQYIGAGIEDFNSLTVSSAIHVESQNQVRFTHSNGVAVFYDYLVGQWGTLTNYTAIGATDWKGSHTVVSSAGLVRVNDSLTYLDGGLAVPMRLETPWVPLAGLQGFQRVYEASFLGENISAHTLQVRIAYDYDNTWVETLTGLSSEITGMVEQFKVRPARQKCQSIKFEVTDLNPVPTAGQGLTLSSMSITVGVKGGINRTKSGQVMT